MLPTLGYWDLPDTHVLASSAVTWHVCGRSVPAHNPNRGATNAASSLGPHSALQAGATCASPVLQTVTPRLRN